MFHALSLIPYRYFSSNLTYQLYLIIKLSQDLQVYAAVASPSGPLRALKVPGDEATAAASYQQSVVLQY